LFGDGLTQTIKKYHITHATLSPSVLSAMPEQADLEPVKTLIVAGEASTSALVKRWAKGRRFINAYGPTEITVCATIHECSSDCESSPPIGRPISNTRIYILDNHGEPLPIGVTGEIYIGGAGVARGYLNRPELTAERFIPDPFSTEPSARMYKTGDLARYLPDGNIEFLGRNDFQVKIRGFRIELGEIEARLSEYPGIIETAILAREIVPGDKRLVAYYTGENDKAAVEADALRAYLKESLPDHMVPAAYVNLPELPLTHNGKLNRNALPEPDEAAYATCSYEPPQGDIETRLATIWAEMLKIERVGRHDNFFELGGHSLMAVRVVSHVRQILGVEINLTELFNNPILSEMAKIVK